MINFPLIRSKMMKADTDYHAILTFVKVYLLLRTNDRNDIEAILNK